MATKILIVDDRVSLPRFIAMELQTAGYQTCISCDNATEPSIFWEVRPDLVILNWDLRRTSGSEICGQLKAGDRQLPIVAITVDDEGECYLAQSVQTCLTKPFLMTDLLNAIEQISHGNKKEKTATYPQRR